MPNETDPTGLRIDAAKLLLDKVKSYAVGWQVGHRLGVVQFGTNTETDVQGERVPQAGLVDPRDDSDYRKLLEALAPRNMDKTDYLPAMRDAIKMLQGRSNETGGKGESAIVILTDGQPELAEGGPLVGERLKKYMEEIKGEVEKLRPRPPCLYVVAIDAKQKFWPTVAPEWRALTEACGKAVRIGGMEEARKEFARAVPSLLGLITPECQDVSADGEIDVPPYLDELRVFIDAPEVRATLGRKDTNEVVNPTGPMYSAVQILPYRHPQLKAGVHVLRMEGKKPQVFACVALGGPRVTLRYPTEPYPSRQPLERIEVALTFSDGTPVEIEDQRRRPLKVEAQVQAKGAGVWGWETLEPAKAKGSWVSKPLHRALVPSEDLVVTVRVTSKEKKWEKPFQLRLEKLPYFHADPEARDAFLKGKPLRLTLQESGAEVDPAKVSETDPDGLATAIVQGWYEEVKPPPNDRFLSHVVKGTGVYETPRQIKAAGEDAIMNIRINAAIRGYQRAYEQRLTLLK